MTNTPQPLEITLDDLNTVRTLIDVVSQRGAFMGNELSSVGMLRDKIHAVIEATTTEQEKEDKEEPAAD